LFTIFVQFLSFSQKTNSGITLGGAVYQYVCNYAFTVQLELNQNNTTAPPSNILLKKT
jgi:hypothetical protein